MGVRASMWLRRRGPPFPLEGTNWLLDRYIIDNPSFRNRNRCVCGKRWRQLKQSWADTTDEEKAKWMFRQSLQCKGHVPVEEIHGAEPNTVKWW